jgi:hypothetical protein
MTCTDFTGGHGDACLTSTASDHRIADHRPPTCTDMFVIEAAIRRAWMTVIDDFRGATPLDTA